MGVTGSPYRAEALPVTTNLAQVYVLADHDEQDQSVDECFSGWLQPVDGDRSLRASGSG